VRLPRTQKLIQYSREAGMMFQLRKPGIGNDLNKLKGELESMQRWIWDIDMDRHVKEAKDELVKVLTIQHHI